VCLGHNRPVHKGRNHATEGAWMSAKTTCKDCYFRNAGLCALPGETPCPTFRALAASGRLQPPRQARLVIRPTMPLVASPGL